MSMFAGLTLAELKALRAQIQKSAGQKQVRFADREVTWSDDDDKRAIVADLNAEIAAFEDTRPVVRRVYPIVGKGF